MIALKETFKQSIVKTPVHRQLYLDNVKNIPKTCIITGASRGIGALLAKRLAENNYNVVIAAKSVKENEKLPGTIYSVAKEIISKGGVALPVKTDIQNEKECENLVNETIKNFGKVDVLINNAGALWWKSIKETPVKRYDLINNINVRGSYILSHLCLPYMEENNFGHIIMQSPPFNPEEVVDITTKKLLKNKTAYTISKLGMSIVSRGISQEYENKNICSNTIWPVTPIKTHALTNNNIGDDRFYRKPDILVDAIEMMLHEDPKHFNGRSVYDEDYLRDKGITDFKKYRCDENFEPPKIKDVNHLMKN